MIMDIITSRRFLVAIAIALIGAILAAQILEYWPRLIAILATLVITILILFDEGNNTSRKGKKGDNGILSNPINEHPEFKTMINFAPNPIIIISKGRVFEANLSAIQLLGAPLIGQNIAGAFRHAEIIDLLAKQQLPSNIASTPENNDTEMTTISGLGQRDQLWDMSIHTFGNEYKLVQLFDKSIRQSAEKIRVDFVANASHELLTPLASIKGFIETLSDDEAGSNADTRERFLKIIGEETNRMEFLIRDLMSLSRIESSRTLEIAENLNFEKVVKEALSPLMKGSDKRGQDIVIEIHDALPRVVGDKSLLRQMIVNIVANSMKYAQAETPIIVSARITASRSMIRFSVKDHGKGITAEHIPRLTERFYRVDSGRSKALGGTGLGLSLVKHIVQRHRGHIEIKSSEGDGTHISILLPIAAIDQNNIDHLPRPRRLQGTDIA